MPNPSSNNLNEELNTAKQVQPENVGALTRAQLTPEAAPAAEGHDVPGHDHGDDADEPAGHDHGDHDGHDHGPAGRRIAFSKEPLEVTHLFCRVGSDALYGLVAAAGALAAVPTNPRRRDLVHFAPCSRAKRHRVEQTANQFRQHRRLATRYDQLGPSFKAFSYARIVSRHLD